MTAQSPSDDRDKVVTRLPPQLRRELKIRAATVGVAVQDAVTAGILAWRQAAGPLTTVDTARGTSFSTYVPSDLYRGFRADCSERGIRYTQGLAQSVRLWLDSHPLPRRERTGAGPRRIALGNQKGGVGKTALSAGIAAALAETGFRVCLVDFDPQGHLTKQLGHTHVPIKGCSLTKAMVGEGEHDLRSILIRIEGHGLGDRLHLLPACTDGFLLDAKLVTSREVRVKETALEKALAGLEQDFDFVIVDCPPSLGYAMDTALYYVRTREAEQGGLSGIIVPVQAEDSSADAYELLREQIDSLCDDLDIDIADLGFIVNLFDSRKGFVVKSALEGWESIGTPPVLAVVPDLKDQREAVRMKLPLLSHAPDSEQAELMRTIARRIAP
ncbi:ParA family protein [Kitasatospora sp. NPDC101801]|uniref:ParA family protein n=1 Tax=Kitasatospora sp. NPDC101801 TaxID=3364103 RepID=UPI0037FBA5B1